MYIARLKSYPDTFVIRVNGPVTRTFFTRYDLDGKSTTYEEFVAVDDSVYIKEAEAKKLLKGRKMIRCGTQIEI